MLHVLTLPQEWQGLVQDLEMKDQAHPAGALLRRNSCEATHDSGSATAPSFCPS